MTRKAAIRLLLGAVCATGAAGLWRCAYHRGQRHPVPTLIHDAKIIGGDVALGTRASLIGCTVVNDRPVSVSPGAHDVVIAHCRFEQPRD